MSLNELITVESPNKCKSWFKYSGGIDTIATAGHFMGLPKGEMGIDLQTYNHKFVIEKKNIFDNLKKKAKGKIVYIAADEDREGEAIGYMTYQVIKDVAKAVYRIGTNEITPAGIKRAIDKKILFEDLSKSSYYSFLGRRLSDRIIGYVLSPMASRELNGNIEKDLRKSWSIGRVQTIGVKLIYDKEMEIRNFIPKPFYSLSAFLDIENKAIEIKHENGNIETEEEVVNLISKLENLSATVSDIKKGAVKTQIVTPFTTSTLQQDCSSKLGIGVKKSMEIAQSLFEAGLITYHRTDQCKLNDEFNNKIRDYISSTFGPKDLPAGVISHASKNSQADAHEGVRPTDLKFDSNTLKGDEKLVYDLIMSRTVASQMASPSVLGTVIKFSIGEENFIVKSQMIKSEGYLQVYKRTEKKKELTLPELKVGDEFPVQQLKKNDHSTKPPARYSEASLVKKLESDGIGRPSTYATIIDTIQKREYGELKGEAKTKVFHLLDKGEALIKYAEKEPLVSWILDLKFTAYLEEQLDLVQHNKRNYKDVIKEIHGKMDFKIPVIRKKNLIDKDCPCCGGKLEELEEAFKCENYKYNKNTGISDGCQFMVFKDPLGLSIDNLDDLFNGKVYQVDGKYGLQNLTLDMKAIELCKSGKKLKKGQGLITKKKDLIEGISCPKCGCGISQSLNQYSCENVKLVKQNEKFKNIGSCDFKVNKKNDYIGYQLDDDMFDLLLKNKSLLLDNGKTILLDLENEYFIVDEEYKKRAGNIKKTGLDCPCCGSEITENEKVFSCSKTKKKNCKFIIYKENQWKGYTLDLASLNTLLNKEELAINDSDKIILDLDNQKSYIKYV